MGRVAADESEKGRGRRKDKIDGRRRGVRGGGGWRSSRKGEGEEGGREGGELREWAGRG